MSIARSVYHLFYRKFRWEYLLRNYRLPVIDISDWIGAIEPIIPPIMEELYLPPYRGNAQYDDVTPLLQMVQFVEPKIVVELGTAYGTTTANICALSNARVYTVNAKPEQIEGYFTTVEISVEDIGKVYRKYGYGDRVIQIYENTRKLDLIQYMGDEKADLVIIDACHDPDFVVSDFLRVLPVTHKHSIVFLHDVSPTMEGHLRASYVACMYLRKLGYNVYYCKGSSWGIWRADQARTSPSLMAELWERVDRALLRLSGKTIFDDVSGLYWLAKEHLQPT